MTATHSGWRSLLLPVGLACGASMLVAFTTARRVRFEEIDVERINVVEPDGRLRMVIANRAKTPGPIERGVPFGYPAGRRAGMLYYNDEETEAGGLIVSGKKEADGSATAVGSLTFDQFDQDQNIALQYVENGGRRRTGLAFSEYPATTTSREWSARFDSARALTDTAVRRRRIAELRAMGSRGRLWIGRTFDGDAMVDLADAAGVSRLRLLVDSAGEARIQFLDTKGGVRGELGAAGFTRPR